MAQETGCDEARARLMGDRAVLIECPGTVPAVAQAVQRARKTGDLVGVSEVVPAARTVLVCCDGWAGVQSVLAWVRARGADGPENAVLKNAAHDTAVPGSLAAAAPPRSLDIDVVYNGEDLAHVADLLGVSVDTLAAAHGAATWQAAFGGFAPGFMYLAAKDWPYRLPRLDTPRERVAAGAVAVAGEFSAVYPAPSPGGWQLIGRTNAQLWDLDREDPALVRPGDAVRFRTVREVVQASTRGVKLGEQETAFAPAFTVVRPGMQTLIQDLGRGGYRAVGVTESGAMDRAALVRANEAVGNPAGAAALEVVAGGLELRVVRPTTVAIAGSAVTLEIHDGDHEAGTSRTVPTATPVEVVPGQRLTLAHAGPGMRDYFAVRGGMLGVAERRSWLGSRSTDTLSGIGPHRLTVGDALYVGDALSAGGTSKSKPQAASGPVAPEATRDSAQGLTAAPTILRVLPGPRDEWFTYDALRTLGEGAWTVSPQSNRVGARLTGPTLVRDQSRTQSELPSEGMVRGALQVPPSGEPVLFLADHPVTGGYPVIGVVVDADLDRAGQLGPGDSVRFELVREAADSSTGEWPAVQAPTTQALAAREVAERPAWVSCTLELDGRRHAIRIPGALAAALDRTCPDGQVDHGQDPALSAAARELLADLVVAIRSEVSREAPPAPLVPPARPSRTD